MIEIDGSMGEGGGQVLRTALSLSCITGKPFRIFNIRKHRSKPGLMRQHLVAVQAAARISSADLRGGQLGSSELSFTPGAVGAGEYRFDIGTAGSTPLVLQTLIPPLLVAGRASRLTLTGGTHVPFSPSAHYLTGVFAPALLRLGARVEIFLDCCGFYPKGGGVLRCHIHPCARLAPLVFEVRGELRRIEGTAAVTNLPASIAERESHAALQRIQEVPGATVPTQITSGPVKGFGQGTFIFLKADYEHAVAGFTSLGARGKPAETVGEEAAAEFLAYHATGMPVDLHLADQLVLYLAQADGPSRFATSCITAHLETNLQVTSYFLDEMTYNLSAGRGAPGLVAISPGTRRSLDHN